jgi:hypothetical protein
MICAGGSGGKIVEAAAKDNTKQGSNIIKEKDIQDIKDVKEIEETSKIPPPPKNPKERDLYRETYEYFLERTDSHVPTLQISKHIFGSHGTKSMINPILYKLQSEGVIRRVGDMTKGDPHWKMC